MFFLAGTSPHLIRLTVPSSMLYMYTLFPYITTLRVCSLVVRFVVRSLESPSIVREF
jgi:hypothetical protein